MRFSTTTVLAASLTLLSGANAIITGVTTTATVIAGEPFTLTLTTADYIQTVYDVSVAFGIAPASGHSGFLGDVFASAYLGPTLSNTLNTIPFTVIVPKTTTVGTSVITAAVTSLYGLGGEPVVDMWNTTVSVVTA
jgi:hypothetical protein